MHVVIECPAGTEVECREIDDNEIMDPLRFARGYANDNDLPHVADSVGMVPNCCGDIRVSFVPDPACKWHIWAGQSFYFGDDDD